MSEKQIYGPYVKAPFQETDTQYQPWDKLYLDVVGPLPMTEEGYKYILTCQDNLSKYLLAIPMITQTADEVALTFFALCSFALWYTKFNCDRSGVAIYE